ncbi:hypothetical protein BGZ57DRAFT_898302 [Hyaloscypha finlandica]|nr:hypothetical protein F5882DRAFT_522283 [Hyaloscypha sp. PMI_1271]KAH8769327.1 hypothetical protein BGZ57DRAFT_898302 [Hyaloscypha finlandica]
MLLSLFVSYLTCNAVLVAANPSPPAVSARAVRRVAQRNAGLVAKEYTTCFDDKAISSKIDGCQSSANHWYQTTMSACDFHDMNSALSCKCQYTTLLWNCNTSFCPEMATVDLESNDDMLKTDAGSCTAVLSDVGSPAQVILSARNPAAPAKTDASETLASGKAPAVVTKTIPASRPSATPPTLAETTTLPLPDTTSKLPKSTPLRSSKTSVASTSVIKSSSTSSVRSTKSHSSVAAPATTPKPKGTTLSPATASGTPVVKTISTSSAVSILGSLKWMNASIGLSVLMFTLLL